MTQYSDQYYVGVIDDTRNTIAEAFNVWTTDTGLVFSEISDPNELANADIRVSFLKGYHGDNAIFDGPGWSSLSAQNTDGGRGVSGNLNSPDSESEYVD